MPRPPQSPGFRGSTLRVRRIHRNVSRAEIASACGVAADTVGSWERGLRTPSEAAVETMARLLGCKPRDLFREVRLR